MFVCIIKACTHTRKSTSNDSTTNPSVGVATGGTQSGDSENLNAIFYEHLTSVLKTSLCGDLLLGRWGQYERGDFFLLSSDYLNCLVHVIECGNGFVTFQLRGLEFKGTYCQQRELEAITQETLQGDTNAAAAASSSSANEGSCCCCCCFCCLNRLFCRNLTNSAANMKLNRQHVLSMNAAWSLRWVAWSIIAKKYIVNAYRIVDNDLSLIVNFYSLRRTLVEFYIKSAIYYTISASSVGLLGDEPPVTSANNHAPWVMQNRIIPNCSAIAFRFGIDAMPNSMHYKIY